VSWHRVIRVVLVLGFLSGVVFLFQRYRRTPEQEELTHYVEQTVPWMRSRERPIEAQLARLDERPGPKPEEARKMLVDEVIPALLKLKKLAADYHPNTAEVRELHQEYVKVTDRLIDAVRACVQVIDDPKLSTVDSVQRVRKEFADVNAAYRTWDDHVAGACRLHRLAAPGTTPKAPAPP